MVIALSLWLLTCSLYAQIMADLDAFFYDDFPMDDIKSLPKLDVKKIGWMNATPEQVKEILAQWCIAMPSESDEPDTPWRPEAAATFAGEYWNKTTADAVRASAFFYGCMIDNKTKKTLVSELVAMKACPIRPEVAWDAWTRITTKLTGQAMPAARVFPPIEDLTSPLGGLAN